MADDDVLHAQIHQHIGADLTGESTGLFKVDVLGAHMDVGALGLSHSGDQIGKRSADDHLAGSVLHSGDQLIHQNSSLGGGLVHLPVASDNSLALCLIHCYFLLTFVTIYKLPAQKEKMRRRKCRRTHCDAGKIMRSG